MTDLLTAIRQLRRAPAFAIGAVLIVALGFGGTSAVLGIANATFFHPLPFREPDRLVRVQEYTRSADGAIRWVDGSAPSLEAMRASGAFSIAGALNPFYTAVVQQGDPLRISVGTITAGWSEALAVPPVLGRVFSPKEEAAGDGAGVAVISRHLWEVAFGARRDVLGQPLRFDGGVRTIVGVLAEGYRFPYDEDAWWPAAPAPDQRGLFLFGRLAPGVSLLEANQRLQTSGPALLRDHPLVMHGNVPGARSMREIIVGDDGRVVVILVWAVALLLLIAVTNVTLLFVTRIVSREREFAVRAALGGGRRRQVALLVFESSMVFVMGAAAGGVVALIVRRALVGLLPHVMVEQTSMSGVPIDARVAAATLAIAILAGVVVGAFAAWRSPRRDLTDALRSASRAGVSRSARRALGALVIGELALATVLLTTVATLSAGLRQLEDRDVGFRTDDLLTWRLELSAPRLRTAAAHLALIDRIDAAFRPVAGEPGVGMSTVNPLCCGDWGSQMTVEGRPSTGGTINVVNYRLVTPSYFSALGLRLIGGRVFDAHDVAGGAPVVVIDQRFASRYWPGENAVGKRVKRGAMEASNPWMQVVGVVSSVEDAGDYTETWYLPYRQYPDAASTDDLHLWMRTRDLTATAAAVRAGMRRIDPALPIIDLRSMETIKRESLAGRRQTAIVALSFGAAGLVLALCGVHALVSFVVARERRDMGVRLALGASGASVIGRVTVRMAALGVSGSAVGLAAARALESSVVRAMGAKPIDFWSPAAGVAAVLVGAAIVAALIPARRILSIDPAGVLRSGEE